MKSIIGFLAGAGFAALIAWLTSPLPRERAVNRIEPLGSNSSNGHALRRRRSLLGRLIPVGAVAALGLALGSMQAGIVGLPGDVEAHNGVRHGGPEVVAAAFALHDCSLRTGSQAVDADLIPTAEVGAVRPVTIYIVDRTPVIRQAVARGFCRVEAYQALNAICAAGNDLEECAGDHWDDRLAAAQGDIESLTNRISAIVGGLLYGLQVGEAVDPLTGVGITHWVVRGSTAEATYIRAGWLNPADLELLGTGSAG